MNKVLTMMLAGMVLVSSTFAFAEDVYVTKNGKKYHKVDCLLIKNKNAKPIALEDALKKGLKPCHKCFPEAATSTNNSQNNAQNQPSAAKTDVLANNSNTPAGQTNTK
ncbi:MAG: hypothetical protein HY209_05540 [Candidatus Omnitrophica bacterium]|nr:hypothetical protein [Candidatus Omnitrophota bacterium]